MRIRPISLFALSFFFFSVLTGPSVSTSFANGPNVNNLDFPLVNIKEDALNHLGSILGTWEYSFIDAYDHRLHYPKEESLAIQGRDYAESVKQTTDGGYIIVGYTDPFRNGEIQGDWDIWLIKTDSYGTKEWDHTYGDQYEDVAYDIIQAHDGGFVIVGYASMVPTIRVIKTDPYGEVEWQKTFMAGDHCIGMGVVEDDTSYMIISYISGERYGQWLIKLDFDGNLIWDKKYEGYGVAIAKTSDNGFIIGGHTEYRGYGSWDLCLTKTDYNGVEQWNCTYGGTGFDRARDVDTCVGGKFFLTGYIARGQFHDLYIVKTDESGNELWSRTYGEPDDAQEGNGVVGLSDGGCIVVGTQGGRYTSQGSQACVIRYGNEGNEEWSRTFGSPFNDVGSDIIQNDEGDFVVIGAIGGENDQKDVWLFKIDSNGNMIWEKRFNRLNNPYAPSITGPPKGVPGVVYEYGFNASDIEGDDLFYLVDWGDGTSQEWLGPYPSGVELILNHTWNKNGFYTVKAKVKDIDGLESAWSKPHVVTMPKSSALHFFGSWIKRLIEIYPFLS